MASRQALSGVHLRRTGRRRAQGGSHHDAAFDHVCVDRGECRKNGQEQVAANRADGGGNRGRLHAGRYRELQQSHFGDVLKSKAGRGTAGARTGEPDADREQYWLDLLVFATSRFGLELEPEFFWSLSWREFEAFKFLWATQQAQVHNAHFATDGVAFEPGDFMGWTDREQRKAQIEIDKVDATFEEARQQARMSRPGQIPQGLPESLTGPYRGKKR